MKFFLFFLKNRDLTPQETICMKCQILFSRKNNKKIFQNTVYWTFCPECYVLTLMWSGSCTKFLKFWNCGNYKRAKMALYRSPDYQTSFKSTDFRFQRRSSIYFLPSFKSTGILFRRRSSNSFSRWQPWWPSWISNQNCSSCFWSASHPDTSYPISSQLASRFKRSSI